VKVVGGCREFDLGVKRFYLPGVNLKGKCPSCGAKAELDLDSNYLSYPTANVDFDEPMACNECCHEWSVGLRLNVSLEVVE
jgi:hypothetical protein